MRPGLWPGPSLEARTPPSKIGLWEDLPLNYVHLAKAGPAPPPPIPGAGSGSPCKTRAVLAEVLAALEHVRRHAVTHRDMPTPTHLPPHPYW